MNNIVTDSKTKKNALIEFVVDKNSNFINHNSIWFILFKGDLLFFDEKNKQLLDDFFYRHQNELSDFTQEYERKKYYSNRDFDNFVGWLGSSVPYLLSGWINNGKDVWICGNNSYNILISNELYQLVKKLPNCNFYVNYKPIDKNEVLKNKGQSLPNFYYHGTTVDSALSILAKGLRAMPDKSHYAIKHNKTVFFTSSFEQAKGYAKYQWAKHNDYSGTASKPCVLKINAEKIDTNKLVLDYDVYNMHTSAQDDSLYNDRMKELGIDYSNLVHTNVIKKETDPRKFNKIGYRGIIMPNAVVSITVLDIFNGGKEMTIEEFCKYYANTNEEALKEDVEDDVYEIGAESDNPPVGGNMYHITENASFDSSEVGQVDYTWDFDEDSYEEWLSDTENENTEESLMEYIRDCVEFELTYCDSITFHECGYEYVDYDTLEDMFGAKMQNKILADCKDDGHGSFETIELFQNEDIDLNDCDSVNDRAMKLLTHGEYYKDCRGFILTNGVVVYTDIEHNQILQPIGIDNKFDFVRMGNIRVLPKSIDIGAPPTDEQRKVLRKVIASYSDDELYLDVLKGNGSVGATYVNPDYRYVMGEIDRFYREGIKPQGGVCYESKTNSAVIAENKYSDAFNNAVNELEAFKKYGAEKYGEKNWYAISWMKYTHPEITIDEDDINKLNSLIKKCNDITKLWSSEEDKEEEIEKEEEKINAERADKLIKLAIEHYGITYYLSLAGFILPDGRLLNLSSGYSRDVDHRNIETIYKENNISIWSTEYKYNYVVDFMNCGVIRCSTNNGVIDMTCEPTKEQYRVIREFVRRVGDVELEFTNKVGDNEHYASYRNAKPNRVVTDIYNYYNEGIKPLGDTTIESNIMRKQSAIITESQESKSISQAKRLVMQRLNYNEQEADEFIMVKLRNDIPVLRTPSGGKFILGVTRMFCDGELRTANDIGSLNSTLKLVASDAHINEYDRNLNGMSYQDLVQRFAKAMSDNLEAEKAEVDSMVFDTPSDYEIVRIDSFEQASEYGRYTSWCVTHNEDMFDRYTSDGMNQFYFCLKHGFEGVERWSSEGCPLDEYGLSMIAISVNENGMLNTCTCRWNHDNGGNDNIMNTKEVSQVIGMNFFEAFKPNGKWKSLINDVIQRLKNGESLDSVFDDCWPFYEGFALVELNRKYNFIDKQNNFIGEQWFDECDNFNEGFARVRLSNKWNFIGKQGNILSDKWFEWCRDFKKGFAAVMINGRWNYINQQANLLSDQWFDSCINFQEGFAAVKLNRKWNFIDEQGKYLSDQWFNRYNSFSEGFAAVELNNEWNYIDKQGNYLSDQWFDCCISFHEGFSAVKVSGKWNFINKQCNYLSDQWFDDCFSFKDGFAAVKLNGRMNFIDKQCNYLSEQWFSWCDDFNDGFAAVNLNGRFNFIDKQGNYLSGQWFDDNSGFREGVAAVKIDGRWYEIDTNGRLHESKGSNKPMITESQESKSISQAKRLVMQKLNYNEQEADEFIRVKLRNDIPVLKTPQGGKFILGAARMFCDGELRTANDIGNLNSTLKLVASDAHINEYDRNLNGMSYQDLIQRFAKAMSDNLEAEKAEVGKMVFDTPSDYEIVRIDSFDQASEYGRYTSWCVTHDRRMFDSYTSDGINQFYFCLKHGFEDVEERASEGCPLDEYGLSMIAVSVNENGMLNTCTCRWNHDNGGNDNIMNTKELSHVIGMNFFEVFKPNGKWKSLINDAIQRLKNGESPDNVFNSCYNFHEGFAMVELNRKWNFIDEQGNLLSDQWFDGCDIFQEGFAAVILNDKWNFIGKQGNILSDKWFDECWNFHEEVARVELNGRWNFIDKQCNYLSDQWFDRCGFFNEDFARIELNGKWNFIDKQCNYLSDQWFDLCGDFYEGFARVKLNGRWNFIDKQNNFIGEQWFDLCGDFKKGFAAVKLNDRWNFIDKQGNLLSDQWFEYCTEFNEGFAKVRINGRWYRISTNGRLQESKKTIYINGEQVNIIKENLDLEVNSSEIDLSSFKKKNELSPNIWKPDGTLNSRVRLKLLDIADDFWNYVNISWVKPSSIILTGSICGFNWSQYSDIDLHLVVNFDDIDEKTEFVRQYLDLKKNEWNNDHKGLEIMGYKVEVYVQDLEDEVESNGIYDLEENDWIKEPNPDEIEQIGLNKFPIKKMAAKIMTIIDDMYEVIANESDSHKIEQMGDDAEYLLKKVKKMRSDSLEKDGESGSGNIVYKYLRRKGYLDKLWKLSSLIYDKENSISEGVSYDGNVNESNLRSKDMVLEYLDKDYNMPLYKYFKWADNASDCEKAKDLLYTCSYYIKYYIREIIDEYPELDEFIDDDDDFMFDDDEACEKFAEFLESEDLCDNFIDEICNIVYEHGDYAELPTWVSTSFNRIVKNEWCIHFGDDAMNIAKEGFTSGTYDIGHLAYTGAGLEKHEAGYDFAFTIDARDVDNNSYGNEAVIFRTSGVEIFHFGDEQRQVIFWGPYAKDFIPIKYNSSYGEWTVEGNNGQVLKSGRPSEIAQWAVNNLPQYRNQILAGKNGYIPQRVYWDKDAKKMVHEPYPIYKNESVGKYITLLKNNMINEEFSVDGNTEHNPYSKRWKAEREALKDFVCNYGTVMQSKEDDKGGKLYKVFYDKEISNLIGYNYGLCVQWDAVELKPKSIVYIRAIDKFTPNIRQVQFDTRGRDNVIGTYDDRTY